MATPRLIIVSTVRNEADIIETFVRHHASAASRMVFVLHRCIDNTQEILECLQAEGLPIELHEEHDPAYPNVEVLGGIITRLAAENAADWIVPLDADEFLTAGEGRTISDALSIFGTDHVVTLAQKTYVPTPEDDAAESNPIRRIMQRRTAEQPGLRTMLLPAALLKTVAWKLSAGTREVTDASTGQTVPTLSSAALAVAHFPVRSPEQLSAKVLGGWASLAGNPGADPRRSVQWHALAERCAAGRPVSLSELRNIALRYGMPEGTIAIPGLVFDPIPTDTHRPQVLVQRTHPIAVLLDNAIAYARTAGEGIAAPAKGDDLAAFAVQLSDAVKRLHAAFIETKIGGASAGGRGEALTCVLLLLAAIASSEPLSGSSLAKRQKLGSLIALLPPEYRWIPEMLQANKLPFALESALQEIVRLLQSQDFMALRQQCRRCAASDDLVLHCSQRITDDLRRPLPVPLGTFLAHAVHTLLMQEAGIALGTADPRVHVIHPACGRGEIAGEMLRRMVNAGIERGANPDMLRAEILRRTTMQESSPVLNGVLVARISTLLQALRMPLLEGETLPIYEADEKVMTWESNDTIPIVCTVLGEEDGATMDAATEAMCQRYLRSALRYGMEQDASASSLLKGIARVHTLLETAETGIGAIVAPRALLHSYIGSTMREILLEDFEQIRILDLHGNPTEGDDDEPLDGADSSGTCILLLLRAPNAAQKTLFMEWKGMKLQKYHALLSRGVLELPWKVIAPEKPGYVFLP